MKTGMKYFAGPAGVCSSLYMAGFSISVVKLDAEGHILQALLERPELLPKFIRPASTQKMTIDEKGAGNSRVRERSDTCKTGRRTWASRRDCEK